MWTIALFIPLCSALVAPPPLKSSDLYLGVDLSTQSCTGVLLDNTLKPACAAVSINFDERLPEFGTSAGMSVGENGVVTSPVRMWLKALDLLFDELKETGQLGKVAAISCSGQQHGSVYWTSEGIAALEKPPAGAAFAGGAAEVAKLTGSRAYERFTGVQMLAVANRFPGAWKSTSHVSLVSSFCASLLSAALQPMDYSDASGTLLMDVSSRKWAKSMLSCKPMESLGLSARLAGEPVPSHQVVGTASPLLSERWGLEPSTIVIASSGDNPCAIAGLGLSEPGDLALSLGTSDTLLGVAPASSATPALEGHVMAHPTDPKSVFGMLCYKNGGAARQAIQSERCSDSWATFDDALKAGEPGNGGVLGLHLPLPEITPIINRAGVWLVDPDDKPIEDPSSLNNEQSVRAVVEGRFLSMRARGGAIGLQNAKRILATGGGSQSSGILQVCADVFNAPVLADDTPDAAAVGAAKRAAHAHALAAEHDGKPEGLPYEAFLRERAKADEQLEVVATPRGDASEVYDEAFIKRYKGFEDRVASGDI